VNRNLALVDGLATDLAGALLSVARPSGRRAENFDEDV